MRLPIVLLSCCALASCSASDGAPVLTIDAGPQADATTRADTATTEDTRGSVRRCSGLPPSDCDALDAKLEQGVTNLSIPGAAMALSYSDDERHWSGAAGYARLESMERWEPGRLSRIGSVTKSFTAALVFLLAEEGALDLDDPLEQWVPGFYDGQGVTLRHLLSNTSGIVSYNYVGSFDDTRAWTPTELVDWAVMFGPEVQFEPGSQWEYSNTNFVLLGMAIEAASGQSYAAAVTTRLLQPLGLADTYLAGTGDINPSVVDCYDTDGNNITDVADPSFGWAAGAIVSTPSDLARWAAALYGGAVLSSDSLELMLTPTVLTDGTVTDYGLGAFIEQDGTDALYGHTGGIGGYLTYMYFWKADQVALVVMVNELEVDLRDLAGYGWSVPLDFDHP